MFDRNLRLVEWNRRYQEIFAYAPGRLTPGLSLEELLRIDSRHGVFGSELSEQAIADLLAKARLIDPTPQEFHTRNGQILELTRSPVPDGGHVVSIRDITAYRRAEQQAMAARDQAELANRAKSEFLANMSHELRTPLNAIIGFSEVMSARDLRPARRRELPAATPATSSRAAIICCRIINDILDLSKIEAGRFQLLSEEDVDLNGRALAVLRPHDRRAPAGSRAVAHSAVDARHARSSASTPGVMQQMLLNLLSNAVKFTPRGGSIVVSALIRDADGLAYPSPTRASASPPTTSIAHHGAVRPGRQPSSRKHPGHRPGPAASAKPWWRCMAAGCGWRASPASARPSP